MTLLYHISHNFENFKIFNKLHQDPKLQNKNVFQNKGNNNNNIGRRKGKKRRNTEISSDREERSVELKAISKDIIAERKNVEMCLKCGKGPHNRFKCFVKNRITTRTVSKKGSISQVRDTIKEDKKEDVKISAVGKEDEYGGRIIELVTDSDGDYELLK